MRTTSGKLIAPRVRQRYLPTCVINWARQGYEKASYCISHTGRQPAMHSPTAAPRMPASASGVSKQRSGPKRSRSPAVARKTPPARPTSSPITITDASRSSSTWKQSLIASTMERSAKRASQLVEIGAERRRRIDERIGEQQLDVGGGLLLRLLDALAHFVRGLGADRCDEIVVQNSSACQIALEAADALALLLLLDPLEVDVRARIVGRRVRRGPVGHRFDEGRSFPGSRTRDRLARRLVAGKDVGPVHPQARDAVADGLVGKCLRTRLRLDGSRDRPAVVVAEQDQRRPGDACEVRAFVERALGGRAVAEEGDRTRALTLQLLPPGEPGRVGHVR